MIGPKSDAAQPHGLHGGFPGAGPQHKADAPPWERAGMLSRLSFACLLLEPGTGPERERVRGIAAWRRAEGGGWDGLELTTRGDDGAAEEAWLRLGDFLEGRRVLVEDRARFLALGRELSGGEEPPFAVQGLRSLCALLLPGRLGTRPDLVDALTSHEPDRPEPAPAALHAALRTLVARVLSAGEERVALIALGFAGAAEGLARVAPAAADELALALQLLEHPSRWREGAADAAPAPEALRDGALSDALRAWDTLEDAVDAAVPAWTRRLFDDTARGSLPEALEHPVTLGEPDRALVDRAFEDHVQAVVEARGGEAAYRPGQHQVARTLAEGFGSRELLLVHAPTGTGKTLAYLVPSMLWSLRNSVRVGVATFTRALQEQAMERDVPFARAVLARAGVEADEQTIRVVQLKGRQNYLCWRSLRLASPPDGAPPLDVLAWLSCALFSMEDPDGDLDRLPRAAPLPALTQSDPGAWSDALEALIRTCRGEPRCCTNKADRDTCGAEVARRRAERAHVVVTNHAFALARREFFRHVVFDECEHLHDVAHNTFSRTVATRVLSDLLKRFHRRGARRPPLNRVERLAPAGTAAWTTARHCIIAREAAGAALITLEAELTSFEHWREEQLEGRREDDAHSLFREYADRDDAEGLLAAQADLLGALDQLEAGCARLAEHLEETPTRGVSRARRQLEVLRNELAERREAVGSWIPRDDEGEPRFRQDTFHDVELRPNGDRVLAARVLLPHEFLGRSYYPDLFGAVLISATTWLKGGFDAQATYLGLTRAASPAEDEERFACDVRTFRAPETFDYGRVLLGVPRDAPSVRDGKQAYLGYVARLIGALTERTRGKLLALFTNADDVAHVAALLQDFLAARRIELYWQGQRGATKEELGARFRARVDSVLLGLDTFWYGADFPGETLEHLVIARLPYGVPDRYHHAQCAALGRSEQRRQVYMPRALAKLRQGFGRLMRTESDRGSILVLDKRLADPRHRPFLRELPLRGALEAEGDEHLARLIRGDTDHLLEELLTHVGLDAADLRARPFSRFSLRGTAQGEDGSTTGRARTTGPAPIEGLEGETPF